MRASLASQEFHATLTLRVGQPPAGSIVLQNLSDSDARFWNTGNTWGDDALSFEVRVSGREAAVRIVKTGLQRYTRNVPSSALVAPGGRHEILFDLGDGTWDLDHARDVLTQRGAELRATYDSGDTPEARVLGVWQGRLHTPFVAVR